MVTKPTKERWDIYFSEEGIFFKPHQGKKKRKKNVKKK